MSQYDLMYDLKINVGHCDLYFMVQWFLPYISKTVWCMNITLWDYESVWPDVWPQNKCRSLWPIFHDPVTSPYISKTIWCMNIILRDHESAWHDIWPKNKCRSLWPIFHGPVILPYILKTVCYMNTILWDYESVWRDVWPRNICSTLWPIFHGPGILPNILKTIQWQNIGIMSQYDQTCELQIFVCFSEKCCGVSPWTFAEKTLGEISEFYFSPQKKKIRARGVPQGICHLSIVNIFKQHLLWSHEADSYHIPHTIGRGNE